MMIDLEPLEIASIKEWAHNDLTRYAGAYPSAEVDGARRLANSILNKLPDDDDEAPAPMVADLPPTPWKVAKDPHYAEALPFTIVDRDLRGVGAAIELRDARLMATAPDMAQALRALVDHHDNGGTIDQLAALMAHARHLVRFS